jgi:hypothetical protein
MVINACADRGEFLLHVKHYNVMSAIFFLVIIPAVIAFLFSLFVAYYALLDVHQRQLPSSDSEGQRIKIDVPGQP